MTLTHLLILLLVGAVVGLIAERLVNRALPYGWIGAIAAGLLGAWLMTDELHVIIAPKVSVVGIPLISAILVSGIASAVVLRNLELEIHLPEHIFAGRPALARVGGDRHARRLQVSAAETTPWMIARGPSGMRTGRSRPPPRPPAR